MRHPSTQPIAALWLLYGLLLAVSQAASAAEEPRSFNIRPQPLASALLEFSQQADQQVVGASEVIGDQATAGVTGRMSPHEALEKLLSGTGLTFTRINERTVRIRPVAPAARTTQPVTDDIAPPTTPSSQGAPGTVAASGTTSAATGASGPMGVTALNEIIVTAEKRVERLQDVPVPVTAISAAALSQNNQSRLQDYYDSVPGVSISSDGYASSLSTFAIRGVTTGGFGNPTVGVSIDDVPLTASLSNGFGGYAPDIDPSELQRVEVLRGPQGTLYGAESMGGLIKYVTIDPSTAALNSYVQSGGDRISNGSQTGYDVRGAINVPLLDTLAVRLSAFTRLDPGYIDNPYLHASGINKSRTDGGRLSVLWKPGDDLSVKVSAMIQDARTDGYSFVESAPGLSGLEQAYIRDTGIATYKYQIYDAIIHAKEGPVDIASITGYSILNAYQVSDLSTGFFGSFAQSEYGVAGAPSPSFTTTDKFSQELRASVSISPKVDWLLGLFYTYEHIPNDQFVNASDPLTGAVAGELAQFVYPSTYTELAEFTDLTVHFSDAFDVQFGGRESENRQTYVETDSGPYAAIYEGGSPFMYPKEYSKGNAFTYLLTPRYRFSPDLMVYARLASGFRPGGPNTAASVSDVPRQFSSDKTENYEIGAKGTAFDRLLSFDTSIYYIDWRNIQLSLQNPSGFGYFANGGRAKSQGVELSLESKPLAGLTLAGWAAWNDAVLTQALPSDATVYGASGDRLPNSARWSAHLAGEERYPLATDWTGIVGADMSYVGDREGVFVAPPPTVPPRQIYPAYTKLNVHLGATQGPWTANLFVNNLTDRRAIIAGGIGFSIPYAFQLIQPRTIGINVSRSFGP